MYCGICGPAPALWLPGGSRVQKGSIRHAADLKPPKSKGFYISCYSSYYIITIIVTIIIVIIIVITIIMITGVLSQTQMLSPKHMAKPSRTLDCKP